MNARPIICLLTDFGLQDVYVGVMKTVIARIAPEAICVDLTHEIPPGDIRAGAFALWQTAGPGRLPLGTTVLAVVDPGVGTNRKAVVVDLGSHTYVGPDNGLVSYLLSEPIRAYELPLPSRASQTFHGRDVFAPAAAHLAAGAAMTDLGAPVKELVRLPAQHFELSQTGARAEVLHVDRFGNAVTGIALAYQGETVDVRGFTGGAGARWPVSRLEVVLDNGKHAPLRGTYGDVADGAVLAYLGSCGLLEIGIRNGNASEILGLHHGSGVTLQLV